MKSLIIYGIVLFLSLALRAESEAPAAQSPALQSANEASENTSENSNEFQNKEVSCEDENYQYKYEETQDEESVSEERTDEEDAGAGAGEGEEFQEQDINYTRQDIKNPFSKVHEKRISSQNFSNTVMDLFLKNEVNLFELDQELTKDFDKARDAKARLNWCHKFIDASGNYGPYANTIVNSIDQYKELQSLLTSDATATKEGMSAVCPRFKKLNYAERKDFWVWTMTSLALFESTCGFDTTNPRNTNAIGIYQLHRSTADRSPRASLRNKICGTAGAEWVKKPENNIFCALDFIRDSFSSRWSNPGLITKAQQFEKLRNSRSGLVKVIKKFKICHQAP